MNTSWSATPYNPGIGGECECCERDEEDSTQEIEDCLSQDIGYLNDRIDSLEYY